jgi:geranylgeranyl pyrophosphate synthase
MFAETLGRTDLYDFEANKDVYFSCGMTEIVHNGSLMVDDLEDQSHMRRGDLCTYKKFGTDVAVNCGNFMYLAPMNKIDQFVDSKHHLALLRIFMSEMQNLHIG